MDSRLAAEVERAQLAAARALTPEQRLQAFRSLCEQVARLAAAGAALREVRAADRAARGPAA